MVEDKKIMLTCFACGSHFQFGPHVYDGKHIRAYDISVCRTCYEANHDGWLPEYGEKITEHAREKGLPIPQKNSKGFLPRGD